MAVFIRLRSIGFDDDDARATFVFESDEEELFRFTRTLVDVEGGTDAMVFATAIQLAEELRSLADNVDAYAAAVKSGAERP